MSVTVLSEFTGSNSSNLLSPFMRPVLYFSVSGDGTETNPLAEIEFNGTTEDVIFDAVFLETVSSVHYFMVDLSDIMKYLIKGFDGGSYPDDLEFITGDRLQIFDEYFRSLTIDIYYMRGESAEQTLVVTNTWIYLANQIPTAFGFNLENVYNMDNIEGLKLKWSKNTYNAIFFYHPAGALNIVRGIAELINNIASFTNVDFGTFTSAGANITSAIAASTGKYCKSNTLSVITGDVTSISNQLTLNSGAAPTICLRRVDTNAVVSNAEALSAGANTKNLTSTYTGNVYISLTSTAATNFALANNVIVYPEGYYQLKFSKTTTKISAGLNTLYFFSDSEGNDAILTIDYDPDCTEVFNVCWQHPLYGYISYPFRGNKTLNITAKKINEFDRFNLTMVNVNGLKEITGYDETRRVALTSKINDEYWPLLEYLYSSRHVYLYIGADGAVDSKVTWVECEVSGSYNSRSDRTKGTFTVELILPESFNIKY